MVNYLGDMGYNVTVLNEKLTSLGFAQGRSARNKMFILHSMLRYPVDESFPRIVPSSFIGGTLPVGITKITYSVDLSGLVPEVLERDVNSEVQND
ncbi:hypothetical protein SDC9_163060 [bioreactor metagenome]|uniref:Uncharacterized protein n=1 Tax=bioreactor metagenome TaxID=1076179 RepID=A0A645FPV0_9ZZZZ